MGIYYEDTLENITAIHAGLRVVTATRALTTALTGFDIENGRVLLLNFYGENMGVAVDGVNTVAIWAVPDAGTTSIIATASAVTGQTVGMQCGLNATAFGALIPNGSNFSTAKAPTYLLRPGRLTVTADAGDVGTYRWFAFYVPVDKGAYMAPF